MKLIRTVNFFSLLWLVCLISALVYQAYLAWYFESNDTTNIFLRLARIGGYCLLIIMALFWLPVMRNSLTWLSQFKVSQLLPIRCVKSLHRWLGHALMAFALLHASQYITYFTTLESPFNSVFFGSDPDIVRAMKTTMYEFVSDDESIEVVENWIQMGRSHIFYTTDIAPLMKEDCSKCHSKTSTMTYAVPKLALQTYQEVSAFTHSSWQSRQFRINVSGLVMFTLFLIIWLSSLAWFRRKNFRAFRQIHRLGYLIAILSLLHIPRIEWLVAPCLILLMELITNQSIRRYKQVPARVEPYSDDFIVLHLQLPEFINNKAGHYIQLKSSQFHDKDWHDFSLTGITDAQGDSLIKIQKIGCWTNELMNFKQLNLEVRGGWASPMAYSHHKINCIFIAGGIGITPIFSLLQAWLTNKNAVTDKRVTVVWILRDVRLLTWLQPMLAPLLTCFEDQIEIQIYLTSEQRYPEWLSRLNNKKLQINYGRPAFSHIYQKQQFEGRLTIFTCGPKTMMKEAKKAGKLFGWKTVSEQF